MPPAEISEQYELETGNVIIETFQGKYPDNIPAVLVHSHGPFAWGTDPPTTLSITLWCWKIWLFMAFHTEVMNPGIGPVQQELLDKHYLRKHCKTPTMGRDNAPTRCQQEGNRIVLQFHWRQAGVNKHCCSIAI